MRSTSKVTQDGILVEPGQVWKDCDPRQPDRLVKVEKVQDGYAFCRTIGTGRLVRIAISRMYKHTSGYVFTVQTGDK